MMYWFYLFVCGLVFVNGGIITVEFDVQKNGDAFQCSPNTKSIQVTAGNDKVVLRIKISKEEDLIINRCYLKKKLTKKPDLNLSDFKKDKDGNSTNNIFSATINNINEEFETEWKCLLEVLLQAKFYDVTCTLDVVVNDPVTTHAPPPVPSSTEAPPSEDKTNIWVYIGAGVAVLVISVIIGQTACILYFKQKAKIIHRNARLSTRASSLENTSNSRYISLPGRKKKKPRNEEGIYETVDLRHLSPKPPCDVEKGTGLGTPFTSPVMNRPPLALPAFYEEATSSDAGGAPRPPSLSSLPRNKKKQKKMLVNTKMENSAPDRNIPVMSAHAVPRPSPAVPAKPKSRNATNEHTTTTLQTSPMVSPMDIPVSPRPKRQLPAPNSMLSSSQPLTSSTKPEVKRHVPHNTNNVQISQELADIFKKKATNAVSQSFHVTPKTIRNTINDPKSTPSTPVLVPKPKSFSSTHSMASPEMPTSPKPFRPPNPKVTPPIATIPSVHTSHALAPTGPHGRARVAPNSSDLPPKPKHLISPEQVPIKEDVYEPISEDEEEWTYEPLPAYNIYNV